MSVTRTFASRFGLAIAASLAVTAAACGDDESAQGSGGGGGGGGDAASSSSGSPTSNGSTTSTSTTTSGTGSTSTGGLGECPETPPLAGEDCVSTEPATCHYDQEAVCPDGGFTNASIDATCYEGSWLLDVASSGECCPEYLTQSGAIPCFIEGTICEYSGEVVCDEGGSIGGGVIATCDGETWQTVYEPTGGVCEGEPVCPAEPPASSSACNPEVDSSTCLWEEASQCPDGQGFNVITVAKCNAAIQTWAVGTIFEGAQCAACDDDTCAVEGLACVQTNACDDSEGSVTTGTICIDGSPNAVWDVVSCE